MTAAYKYSIRATGRFKKAVKRAEKRGKDTRKLKAIVDVLAKGETVAAVHKDHALVGNWVGHRELHIDPDWLLIYRKEDRLLILELVATGSHADLFGK